MQDGDIKCRLLVAGKSHHLVTKDRAVPLQALQLASGDQASFMDVTTFTATIRATLICYKMPSFHLETPKALRLSFTFPPRLVKLDV